MTFRIIIDDVAFRRWMAKMPSSIEKRGNEGLAEFGHHAVKRILQQARSKGIKPFRSSRGMFQSTRFEQKKGYGQIVMPMSGVYQDRARAHWVSSPGKGGVARPMLGSWMQRYWGRRYGAFYFEPRPFIKVGLRNAKNRLTPIMRKKVSQAIRESH